MIRKSLIVTLLLLVVYHLALPHLSHKFYALLSQQRGNYLRTQQYVYDIPSETNVVVGSSASAELNDTILGPNYYKLCLPGGCMFTGLEIVRRTGKRPHLVLIETNLVTREADNELLHDLFSPGLFQLRKASRIFREEGRPANFVGGIAEACVRRSCQLTSRAIHGEKPPTTVVAHPDQVEPNLLVRLKRLALERAQYAPSAAELSPRVKELAEYVQQLTERGTTCLFFEMPSDPALYNTPLVVAQRKAVMDQFPPDKFNWISFEHGYPYETTDGIHLVRSDADHVTEVIVQQTNNVIHRLQASAGSTTAKR